jgi:hypothetical protein
VVARNATAALIPNGGLARQIRRHHGPRRARGGPADRRGSTNYRYDATGLSQQTDTSGSTYFTSLPDGTLLSETVSGSTYYYLSDGAGSVAALTDSAGTLKNQYSYDPLGNATCTSCTVANAITFQGATFDSQTGFYYTGSGYYDPATGQAFGCKDKGRVDPGEDLCGEDERFSTCCANGEAHSVTPSECQDSAGDAPIFGGECHGKTHVSLLHRNGRYYVHARSAGSCNKTVEWLLVMRLVPTRHHEPQGAGTLLHLCAAVGTGIICSGQKQCPLGIPGCRGRSCPGGAGWDRVCRPTSRS